MAQHDYVIANASGASVRADINNMALAISSNNSGSSEPSTKYAYLWWLDTSANVLKLRNSANNAWITMPFSITANNTVDVNGGAIDGTNIGASVAGSGAFTTLSASGLTTLSGDLTLASATANKPVLTLTDTNADSQGPDLVFKKDSASPADGDELFRIYGYGDDSGGTQTEYFLMLATMEDVTDGTEDSKVRFMTYGGGSQRDSLTLEGENVGIATASPSTKLHLGGTAPGDSIIRQDSTGSGTNWEIGERSAGKWQIFEDDSDSIVATFQSTGKVGIGTTSPDSALHVDKSFSGTLVTIHNTAGSSSNDRGLDVETSTTGSTVQRWLNGGSEIARITGSAYLMVGTTSTSIGGSSGAGNEGVVLGGSLGNAIAVSNGGCLDLNRKTTNGTILEFRLNGSSVGSISTNANSLPSDRNYKKDIEDLNIGLDLITKLNPVSYNYKIDEDDCPKMFGLIAQDLETSLTEVGVTKNSSWLLQHEPTEDEKESDYALDYLKLTPILIKSIQEQQEQIEQLKTEIQTLKGE